MKPERLALEIQTVVLDAMGVIYSAGDDVKDLLCPFILEKGGIMDTERIKELYISASLGNITSSEFWKSAGIDHNLEDEYWERYTLTDGYMVPVKRRFGMVKKTADQIWTGEVFQRLYHQRRCRSQETRSGNIPLPD
jgi:hypothetical protein